MSMTNAEPQRRYRERRAAGEPVWTFQRPKDRRSRPQRWADALAELRTLQEHDHEDIGPRFGRTVLRCRTATAFDLWGRGCRQSLTG